MIVMRNICEEVFVLVFITRIYVEFHKYTYIQYLTVKRRTNLMTVGVNTFLQQNKIYYVT